MIDRSVQSRSILPDGSSWSWQPREEAAGWTAAVSEEPARRIAGLQREFAYHGHPLPAKI